MFGMSIMFSSMVHYQEMMEKQDKQKCDPFQVLSLNLAKRPTNSYLYGSYQENCNVFNFFRYIVFSGMVYGLRM